MNKQKRLFIILVVVLIVCLAGYMGLLHYNKYKSDDSESESTSVEALSIESSTVRSFSFDINGEQYTFSRVQAAGDESIEDYTEEVEQTQRRDQNHQKQNHQKQKMYSGYVTMIRN